MSPDSGGHHHQHAALPRGLAAAEGGYRIAALENRLPRGSHSDFRFCIEDDAGRPVTNFAEEHERAMHLILVRRDLTCYQHLHPVMDVDGTWSALVQLAEAGTYRAFADFNAGGEPRTLGTDLHVAGEFRPEPLPGPVDTVSVEGYGVSLAIHRQRLGRTLSFSIQKGGQDVHEVEPYLGARGHLVALRQGDLAFLHVHPEDGASQTASVSFQAEYPSRGAYRLFFQFQHAGAVRTVAFTDELGN